MEQTQSLMHVISSAPVSVQLAFTFHYLTLYSSHLEENFFFKFSKLKYLDNNLHDVAACFSLLTQLNFSFVH